MSETLGKIRNLVKGEVNENNPIPFNRLVSNLVEIELSKRTTQLTRGFEELTKLEKELSAIRPKSSGFDKDLKELPPSYSHDDVKKIKETKEKINKLDEALSLAISDTPDYTKLNNLLK